MDSKRQEPILVEPTEGLPGASDYTKGYLGQTMVQCRNAHGTIVEITRIEDICNQEKAVLRDEVNRDVFGKLSETNPKERKAT